MYRDTLSYPAKGGSPDLTPIKDSALMQELRPPPGWIHNQPKVVEPPRSALPISPARLDNPSRSAHTPKLNLLQKMHAARTTHVLRVIWTVCACVARPKCRSDHSITFFFPPPLS